MKKLFLLMLVLCALVLYGCEHAKYEKIPSNKNFLASINILQPSIDFFDEKGTNFTNWDLKEAYTGAILVGDDALLLYGNQMDHADLMQLSTGKEIKKINVPVGTTNAYYNKEERLFYMTNGSDNSVTSYSLEGDREKTMTLGNYPMAMIVFQNKLYVINFKDTFLSVLDSKTLHEIDRFVVPKTSHGMDIIKNELWIGGHGAGEKPNSDVIRMDKDSGKVLGKLKLPSMPIAFEKSNGAEYVLSHGESMLYKVNNKEKIIWKKEVASNPFALASFAHSIIVAGYDDHLLYWIKDQKITLKTKVGKGPFQLIVREDKGL